MKKSLLTLIAAMSLSLPMAFADHHNTSTEQGGDTYSEQSQKPRGKKKGVKQAKKKSGKKRRNVSHF